MRALGERIDGGRRRLLADGLLGAAVVLAWLLELSGARMAPPPGGPGLSGR